MEIKIYKEMFPRSFKAVLVDGINCSANEAEEWADSLNPKNINDYISYGDAIEFRDTKLFTYPFYLVYISTGYVTAYNKEYFESNFEPKND